MTITSEAKRIQYAGNGSTTQFTFPFRILDDDDLLVVLQSSAGVDTTQTKTTHYTVSGVGNAVGGSITMVTAPASGETLSIILDPPATQLTDYTTGGGFPAESHEDALDNLTNIVKRALDRVERSLQLQDGDVDGSGEFPAGSNKITGLANGTASSDAATLANVDAKIASAILDEAGSNLITALGTGYTLTDENYKITSTGGVAQELDDRLTMSRTVKDFGATGDGSTDDTTAFQAAVNSISTIGSVLIPSGTYVVDLDGLTYGSKVVTWEFQDGAKTQTAANTNVFYGREMQSLDGTNGATASFEVTPSDGKQIDIYRVVGESKATGTGSLFAYHFDLTANSTSTASSNEAVRGLVGAVRNSSTGRGSIKGINVTAVDGNTTNGATALMCFESSIVPNSNTGAARIYSGSIQSGVTADNVVTAAYYRGNGTQWANGIVFHQGDEFEDSVLQASMDTGSGASSYFLKLKNAAASILFSVTKAGIAMAAEYLVGSSSGPSITTGTGVPSASVPNGSLYLRTDGTGASLYVRENGAWVTVGSAT